MKKIFIFTLLTIIFIPSITLASWWNPFSWGKNNTTVQTNNSTTTAPAISISSTTIKTIEKPVYKDRIITQTITVQDPTLKSQIESLINENAKLKSQISILTAKCDNIPAITSPITSPKPNYSLKITGNQLGQFKNIGINSVSPNISSEKLRNGESIDITFSGTNFVYKTTANGEIINISPYLKIQNETCLSNCPKVSHKSVSDDGTKITFQIPASYITSTVTQTDSYGSIYSAVKMILARDPSMLNVKDFSYIFFTVPVE